MNDDIDIQRLLAEGPPEPARSKAWLIIFTDLVSLMLTFFVMLFSMSTVQLDKWEEVLESLSRSDAPKVNIAAVTPQARYNISTTFRRRAMSLDYLEAVLDEKMTGDPVLREGSLKLDDGRLIISLPGDLLFDPSRAVLSEDAGAALFTLGGILRHIENPVAVAGHSDKAPATDGGYASNWELSMARAVAVANALRRAGYTRDVTAYGYGDAHYGLLPEELSETEKDRLARRVDIFILSSTGG